MWPLYSSMANIWFFYFTRNLNQYESFQNLNVLFVESGLSFSVCLSDEQNGDEKKNPYWSNH